MDDLAVQIACVKREIGMRERVYPGWVVKRKMTQAKADAEIAAMTAVLGTLENSQRLHAALQELVDLKAMKERGPTNAAEWTARDLEYRTRKPLAWEAARRALGE